MFNTAPLGKCLPVTCLVKMKMNLEVHGILFWNYNSNENVMTIATSTFTIILEARFHRALYSAAKKSLVSGRKVSHFGMVYFISFSVSASQL